MIGPVILLLVLSGWVIEPGSSHHEAFGRRSKRFTRELTTQEEERRREGTDQL